MASRVDTINSNKSIVISNDLSLFCKINFFNPLSPKSYGFYREYRDLFNYVGKKIAKVLPRQIMFFSFRLGNYFANDF